MFFWGGKHLYVCLYDIDHSVLDYISSGCIFAIFSYRRVDGKLLSMKKFLFSAVVLHYTACAGLQLIWALTAQKQLNVQSERCVNENPEISTNPEPVKINV
jgi:hypothetical protein